MKKNSVLAVLLTLCLLSACGQAANVDEAQTNIIDDKYRNWYEVFVYSYADSDNNRVGDFNGVAGKLDYISELGMNGLWLMPIMPSTSYHKYDVTDYYDVDPLYGTLDDFRSLLDAAHERGIDLIIDLPLNHTSDDHPWFQSAKQGEGSEYRDYYNWSETSLMGYTRSGDSYYESRFVSTMPDLNLDNESLRGEIENIMRFWLEDVGVDGFRLDAVTSYYTGSPKKNVEFISWLGNTARAISPDCFIVGEAWENLVSIADYSTAAIDSFFTFPVAQNSGYIAKILGPNVESPGQSYGSMSMLLEETLPEGTIPAPFLDNHDTGRAANFLGKTNVTKMKMAAGLLAMMRGGIFVYYGDEIGMSGVGDDPNKRIGMLWDEEANVTKRPPGTTSVLYSLPSVAHQLQDEYSLLNYYRQAMALRNRHPEIARGASEIISCDNGELCVIRRTWQGESIIIVLNPSDEAHSLSLSRAQYQYDKISDCLTADGSAVVQDGDTLAMPAYSIVILRCAAGAGD